MALNLSQIVTKIKMRMGIYGISIPIENPDEYIRETIELFTIPTFSIYEPYYDHLHVSTDDLQKEEKYSNTDRSAYILPSFTNRKLITVADVKYDDTGMLNYSGVVGYAIAGLLPYNNSSLMQQAMLTNVTSQLYSVMYPKLTFEFIEPCTLIIYNQIISNSLDITLAFQHHKSLATIPQTAEKAFFDLALYDCEANFYQIAKHWDKIETALGTISLNIDDWADAENKRNELLSEWDNTYHLDIPDSIVYK